MHKSLFSSLKIVAAMLATDKQLHPKEKAWFIRISQNYGASFSERALLNEYLQGRPIESLEDLIRDIVDENDKRRLLGFVQMAMRMDGIVRNAEIALFHRIQKALTAEPDQIDYLDMGRELLKRDRDVRAWKALDRFGRVWSKRIPVIAISGHFYYADGEFWESLFEIISIHKNKVLMAGAIAVIGLYLLVTCS